MSLRHLSIVFIAALLVAAACGPATSPGGGTAAPSPTAGGAASTLVWYADVSDLISLDPAVAYEFTGVLLAHNVYETLVKFEGADLSTIKPSLAQSWDIKDSGATWDITFKLKSGVKFASGNTLTPGTLAPNAGGAASATPSPTTIRVTPSGATTTANNPAINGTTPLPTTPEPLNATPAIPLGGSQPTSSSPPVVNGVSVPPGEVPLSTPTPGPVQGQSTIGAPAPAAPAGTTGTAGTFAPATGR